MKKIIVSYLALAACLIVITTSASGAHGLSGATPAPEMFNSDPANIAAIPTDVAPIPLSGEVHANGDSIGTVEFVLFWTPETGNAQLWALWQGAPAQVCVGEIFAAPNGEPLLLGETTVATPQGSCHLARVANGGGVSLLVTTEDGQWATGILAGPPGTADPLG